MMICRLCGSSELILKDSHVRDFEYESPGAYDYLHCRTCGLLNILPVPGQAALSLAYPPTYHAYHDHSTALARWMKKSYWRKKARTCRRYIAPDAVVLDIGCSFGDFLIEMQAQGVTNVKGIDFNPEAVSIARRRGLDVTAGEIDSRTFAPASFDMILITNFIEHVYDPVATLKTCVALLKPGGLIMGETPNRDSWDYAMFRRYWGGYHTPRHLYLFNCGNLSTLARRAGLQTVRIKNLLQPAHWALSIQNWMQTSTFKGDLKRGRAWYFTPLLLMFLPLNFIQSVCSRTSLVEFVFMKEA